jgi:hypothetical protein
MQIGDIHCEYEIVINLRHDFFFDRFLNSKNDRIFARDVILIVINRTVQSLMVLDGWNECLLLYNTTQILDSYDFALRKGIQQYPLFGRVICVSIVFKNEFSVSVSVRNGIHLVSNNQSAISH